MRFALLVVAIALLTACGGTNAPPEEEVTATWTSGDDAPLEGEGVEEEGRDQGLDGE